MIVHRVVPIQLMKANSNHYYSITPLLLAVAIGYCPLRTITVGEGRGEGRRPTVQYPYSFDNDAIVRELIKHGADVNKKGQYKGSNGYYWPNSLNPIWNDITPLQAAMSRGFSKVILCLLKSGADASRALLSPMGYVIRHSSVVELVLKHGADVNATQAASTKTPLRTAISYGSLGIVELLLKRGAHVVDDISVVHFFPFFLNLFQISYTFVEIFPQLCSSRYPPMAELLVRHGAVFYHGQGSFSDPILRTYLSSQLRVRNPLYGVVDTFRLLPTASLALSAEIGDIPGLERLIKKSDVNASDRYGWMALHAAVYFAHHRAVELLIESGANVNATMVT